MRVRALSAEVAHQHPGTFSVVFQQGIQEILDQEIACDTLFRVIDGTGATISTMRAHRSIVQARLPRLLHYNNHHDKSTPTSTSVSPNNGDEGEIVLVGGILVEHPQYLRRAVASCYGTTTCRSNEDAPSVAVAISRMREAGLLAEGDLKSDIAQLRNAVHEDVFIAASPGASRTGETEWTTMAHSSILCAQSQYFRSLLTHWTTTQDEEENELESSRVLWIDSDHFTEAAMLELLAACYGQDMHVVREPVEWILQLLDSASYLGMTAACRQCEEALASKIDPSSLPEMFHFAEQNGAPLLLLYCHKYLCRNLGAVRDSGALNKLSQDQIRAMLQSNFVEAPEDEILEALVAWAQATGAPSGGARELASLVRLPYVPVDSQIMKEAVKREFVSANTLAICTLFQSDTEYRKSMINSESMFSSRQSETATAEMRQMEQEEQRRRREEEFSLREFVVFRMLGTVNGRNSFDTIDSVQWNEAGDKLVCKYPEDSGHVASFGMAVSPAFKLPFSFQGLVTEHMVTEQDKMRPFVDRSTLAQLNREEAEERLALLLRRENALRLHPRVQAVYGLIGEDEAEMTDFTTSLQAFVSSEFNVEPSLGIELIRSASTLFPETARIAHYVRFNRCVKGSLNVGDEAPDVPLVHVTGEATSLWKAVDGRIQETGNGDLPVVVLGASFT